MRGRMRDYVQSLPKTQRLLGDRLIELFDRMANHTVSSAGLVIKAGGSAIVKAGSLFHSQLSDGSVGRLLVKPANTDMAALSGVVMNATHNVFAFFIDNAGTLTSQMGTAGASLAAVTFPTVPAGKACIGYVHINPTGTGNFTGGTTALDDATVVPNAVYVNIVGPFDPTMIP